MKRGAWKGRHLCRPSVRAMLADRMDGPLHLGAALDLTDATLTEAVGALVRDAWRGTAPRELFCHRTRVVRAVSTNAVRTAA